MGAVATGNYISSLVVKVASPLANGTKINNTATIDSTETDVQTATAQTTVSTGPVLSVEKLVDVPTANPGQEVNYSVKVTNSGTDTALNVQLSDTLPAGFTAKDTGLGTVSHTFGSIEAGKTVATTFTVIIGSNVTAGNFLNVVTVTADNHTSVNAQVALNVIVPQVLGEQDVIVDPQPQVLGAETTLPVTGMGALGSAFATSSFIGTVAGVGIYLKSRMSVKRRTKK
jgi:uncharacterized repeat protein (TIGR01451 family)